MQPATLYTLTPTEVLAGDYYALARLNYPVVCTSDPSVAIAPVEDRFVVPIHRVIRCVKPKVDPLYASKWHTERECVFFAVEPALEEMLEAPFKQRMEDAERRQQAATNLLHMAESSMHRFNSLPWWKRCWIALRHGITF